MYRSTQELLTAVPAPVVRCAQVLVLVLLLLALAACERGAGDRAAPVKFYTVSRTAQISVVGSAVMAPLLEGLARQYEQLYPGISVTVTVVPAMQALMAVRNGRSMIGMLARTLRDEESDLQGFPIARDGVALVALAGHPLLGVNRSNLEGLLLGRLPAAGPSPALPDASGAAVSAAPAPPPDPWLFLAARSASLKRRPSFSKSSTSRPSIVSASSRCSTSFSSC